MIPLNHQHLYYFWLVAKEGSVTKASEKLYLSQPTVSGQIAQLQKFLGKKLFERDKNRLRLTEEGRFVFEYANRIFNTAEDMLEALRQGAPHKESPRIRLGIDTHVSQAVAHRCLQMIYAYNPDTQLTLEERSTKDLLAGLVAHELDLLLSEEIKLAKPSDLYTNVEVGLLKIIFVATPKLAKKMKKFPRDLAKIPLLLPSPNSPLWHGIEQFLVKHNIEPEVIGKIHNFEFKRLLALDGVGAAALHDLAVADDLHAGRLVRLNRKATGISKRLWLIAGKYHHSNPIVAHLMRNFRLGQR